MTENSKIVKSVLEIKNLNFSFPKIPSSFYSHSSIKTTFALSEINLKIERGQSVGIIGRNGSGKSTMAKLIAGILIPDQGVITKRTKVAPLIELGAGFDHELTTKENIFLYGLLVGIPYGALKSNYTSILKFSGLSKFENYPLRAFSSGMLARLAFAISTSYGEGLILIDEALSVGDTDFSLESKRRIQSMISKGAASIIISHDLQTIKSLTTKCIRLESGKIKDMGPTNAVISRYTCKTSSETKN
jgi:ABC-2 type transport system ATP-binding protein/lipopolysaccharide transport system ATP-binding protein